MVAGRAFHCARPVSVPHLSYRGATPGTRDNQHGRRRAAPITPERHDAVMIGRVRNPWGWGFADAVIDGAPAEAMAAGLRAMLGFGELAPEQPVPVSAAQLPAPRLPLPEGPLGDLCTLDPASRAGHAYGRSYLDVVRALRGRYDHAPDRWRIRRGRCPALLEWADGATPWCPTAAEPASWAEEPRLPSSFVWCPDHRPQPF